FAEAAREYAIYFKSSLPAEPGGEVLLPGEPERRTRALRLQQGIPLPDRTWAALVSTAHSLGIDPPEVGR
ncbi:MAG: malate dehydrogenase, partial [Acetobacteraceae bacterium]